MSKFFGFLLGVVVALVGPAVFGVLAADGGIELNAKEMALAYGIGALIFWAVVSYFSGAAAIGAALVFGAMIYTVHWIPNRMTNFLNDVPGVTTGMIEGVKQYTLNGVVPILAIISLVYGIQLIVRSAQRRRRERAEAERVQREQELAQAQQAAAAAPYAPAAYPVAGGDYQQPAENRFTGNTSYEDLFDDEVEPEPVQPRNQADEQTALYPMAAAGHEEYDDQSDADDDTRLVPTDGDATVMVPTAGAEEQTTDSPTQAADEDTVQAETSAAQEETVAQQETVARAAEEQTVAQPAEEQRIAPDETVAGPVAQGDGPSDDDTQFMPAPSASSTPAGTTAPAAAVTQEAQAPTPATPAPEAQAAPVQEAQVDPAAETQAVPAEPVLEETQPIAVAPAPERQAGDASGGNAPSSTPSAGAGSAPSTGGPSATSGSKAEGGDGPTQGGSAQGGSAQAAVSSVEPAYGVPVGESVGAPKVARGDETVGQQYRERMEGPEADETGEHQFGAFENPVRVDESVPQAPRVMDLPGQFRPAGT